MKKKLRFGIIACSNVAYKRFLPALEQNKNAVLESIGSSSKDKAKRYADTFGCQKYGSYDEVLNDQDVDCVYISTPVSEHKKYILEAVRKGKHVLCEKPAVQSFTDALLVKSEFYARNLIFLEGFMFRFHPQHKKVLQLINNDTVGTVRLIEANFTYPKPKKDDIRLNKNLNGGVFFDSFGYPLFSSILLSQSNVHSVSGLWKIDSEYEVDNLVTITASFDSGAIAKITSGFDLFYQNNYSIIGTKGKISVNRAYSISKDIIPKIVLERDDDVEEIIMEPSDQFSLMIDYFYNNITSNMKMGEDFDYFLKLHKTLDASYKAISTGKTILVQGE